MNENVIVKFSSNYPQYRAIITKYIQLINYAYAHDSTNPVFMEPIQDGFIIIYTNLATFQKIQTPLTVEFKKKITQILEKESNFLLEGIEHGQKFPANGFQISIECVSHPASVMLPIFTAFYTSMHPDITIRLNSEKLLAISIPNFDAFKSYVDIMFAITKLTLKT